MSGTMPSELRFEDHFGPIVPEVATPSEPSTPAAALASPPTARLRDLAQTMRRSVVQATLAADRAEKVELWASYHAARAEALALLGPGPATTARRRLHSV